MTAEELRKVANYLEETHRVVKQIVAGLSADESTQKFSEDEFSALEQAFPLQDIDH